MYNRQQSDDIVPQLSILSHIESVSTEAESQSQ